MKIGEMRNILYTFFDQTLRVVKIIPFPVWIIPYPVLKIKFEPLGPNENSMKKKFLIRVLEVGEIIPFPVWIISYPVL